MLGPFSINALFYLATVGILLLCVLMFWMVGYDPRRAPRYLRNNARWLAFNALLVIGATHALLLAPPPPVGFHCVESHRVCGPLQMVMTCDSHEFIQNARQPARLATYRSWSQSRPLGIMVASLLTLAEMPNRKHRLQATSVFGNPYGVSFQPGWLPYIILNFVLLLVALMIFRRLIAPATNAAAATVAILGVYLLFNDAVKGFFWSAHTQMWNVLIPLICISLADGFLRRPVRSGCFMIATGALLGIGLLAYGSFIISLPVVICASAAGLWLNHERTPVPALFGKLCLFVGAFAMPTLIWITLIKSTAGAFFSPEAEVYRQFVWVLDSWKAGGAQALQLQTRVFVMEFLVHFWHGLWPILVLLAIALLAGFTSPTLFKVVIGERSHILAAAGITLIMCLGFFASMGFYRNRLAFNAVVPVLVIASVSLNGLLERLPKKQTIVIIFLVVSAASGYILSALLRVTWPY